MMRYAYLLSILCGPDWVTELALRARHAEIASKVPSLGKEGSGGSIYFLVAVIGSEGLTL